MIEFRTPQKIALDDGRLLFAAISLICERLILVGIPYLDRPIDHDSVNLRILRPHPVAPSFERHVRAEYEPCLILSAEVGAEPLVLEIGYEGKTWRLALEREVIAPSRLSLMTLFKHDYRLVPEFVRHYAKLGVEKFYLYYNGPLSEIDWSYLLTSEKAAGVDIQIIEWNIPYWWKLSAPVGIGMYDAQGFQHHAQTMAINHHLHRMKGTSRYTFFVDLDEYVFTPRAALDRACERLVSFIQFQCWWMSPEPPEDYECFSLEDDDKRITICEAGEGPGRTKCLVRVLDVDVMGVHWPHQHLGRRNFISDGYFHIYRFPGIDRSRELVKPVKTMTKSQFLRERFREG